MSTNSTITVVQPDGSYKSVYCHWDGYLSHNGALLSTYYNSPELAQSIVDNGNLSCLRESIGQVHDFDSDIGNENKWCTFYGRDRNNDGEGATTFPDLSSLDRQEYNYLFDGTQWLVNTDDDDGFISLTEAMLY